LEIINGDKDDDDLAKKQIELHYLLNHFLNEVSKQVGIRDKMLVEQSDALFVSRPYLNGRISDGVKTEIKYIKKLHPAKKKLGIVFFPEEDYRDTQIYQVKEGLPAFLYETKMFILEQKNENMCKALVVENFSDEIFSSFNNATNLAEVLKEIVTFLLKKHLIFKNPDYHEKALDSQTAIVMESKYGEFAEKIISSYDSLIKELNDNFMVFKEEFQIDNIVNEFLKLDQHV
jgi:hypothetical protein